MKKILLILLLSVAVQLPTLTPALAKEPLCKITVDLSPWQNFIMKRSGTGTVTCSDGATVTVEVVTHSDMVGVSKDTILRVTGQFSPVKSTERLYGTYFPIEPTAGTGPGSINAKVMAKGNLTVVLTGEQLQKGQEKENRRLKLGLAFRRFDIKHVGDPDS